MIIISKPEALYLRSKGFKNDVQCSSNKRHKKYYCVEGRKVLKELNDYRKNRRMGGTDGN